jgi:hypothetical protein
MVDTERPLTYSGAKVTVTGRPIRFFRASIHVCIHNLKRMPCNSSLLTTSPRGCLLAFLHHNGSRIESQHATTYDRCHAGSPVVGGVLSCYRCGYHHHEQQTEEDTAVLLSRRYASSMPSIAKVDHEASRMAIHRLFSASPTEIHRHRSRDKGERLLPTEFVCGACLSFHLSFPGQSGKFLYAQVVVVLQMVTSTVNTVYQLRIDLGSRLSLVHSQHEHEIGCCPPETT